MTKRIYTIVEVLCVVALVAFIIVLCTERSGGTDKSAEEVAAPIAAAIEDVELLEKNNADIVKTFGFDTAKTDGAAYYASDNVMEVSEVLVVKLKDPSDAQAFQDSISKYVVNQQNLYKNYAPEQYSLLTDCMIEVSGNTVFYCTAKNADALYEIFQKSL